jgi:hypothetical protein
MWFSDMGMCYSGTKTALPVGPGHFPGHQTGNFMPPEFLYSAILLMQIDMQLFQESILLSFLLVAGLCIIGILLREIYVMRKQLKVEMGTKNRVRRNPGTSKKS